MKDKVNNKSRKLHVKTGDTVKVIAGNERGKTGRITSVHIDAKKVVVEGLNMITKHNKPSAKSPNGGISQKEAPIHASNVMLVENGQTIRTGKKLNGEGRLQRYSKKSGEVI